MKFNSVLICILMQQSPGQTVKRARAKERKKYPKTNANKETCVTQRVNTIYISAIVPTITRC